ncbi:MAG: ATP-dependent helicase [Succinivibrionaceae bacterium]
MDFQEFCKKYNFNNLTKQQQDAAQNIKGPILLLAVPGSGKTTVLIARLGYMIYGLGIDPKKILVLTYSVAATKDMTERFKFFFGDEYSSLLRFQTINALSLSIVNFYIKRFNRQGFSLISNITDQQNIVRHIYKALMNKVCTDTDSKDILRYITYIKNMMLNINEIKEFKNKNNIEYPIDEIYKKYVEHLQANKLMDFDDQLRYAYMILKGKSDMYQFIKEYYQNQYEYICVDEAQDTSKIQHKIIEILASKYQNIFMVGDEDQSIYGFRAAYPKALLDFPKTYPTAKVLLMETNFRSDKNIVLLSNNFIQKNKDRFKKEMISSKDISKSVYYTIPEKTETIYKYITKLSHQLHDNLLQDDIAILYRNNESSIPIIDYLDRSNLPFIISTDQINFFNSGIVKDLKEIYTFAKDPSNFNIFQRIYYRIKTYISKEDLDKIYQKWINKNHNNSASDDLNILSIALDIVNSQKSFNELLTKRKILKNLPKMTAYEALDSILNDLNYNDFLKNKDFNACQSKGYTSIQTLKHLSKNLSNMEDLFDRIAYLENLIKQRSKEKIDINEQKYCIKLTTIHGSKGLEYDTVYIIDVKDFILPEIPKSECSNNDERLHYQEERRLFYVATTRARKNLYIIKNGKSEFIKEFFDMKYDSSFKIITISDENLEANQLTPNPKQEELSHISVKNELLPFKNTLRKKNKKILKQ